MNKTIEFFNELKNNKKFDILDLEIITNYKHNISKIYSKEFGFISTEFTEDEIPEVRLYITEQLEAMEIVWEVE